MGKRIIALVLALTILVSQAAYGSSSLAYGGVKNASKDYFVISDKKGQGAGNSGEQESKSLGTFRVNGDITKAYAEGDTYFVELKKYSRLSFSYVDIASSYYIKGTGWHLAESKAKYLNAINLGSEMQMGAIVVQKSLDKKQWSKPLYIKIDAFRDKGAAYDGFYTCAQGDLRAGVYYRIIVAYQVERKGTLGNAQEEKRTELYTVHVAYEDGGKTSATSAPTSALADVSSLTPAASAVTSSAVPTVAPVSSASASTNGGAATTASASEADLTLGLVEKMGAVKTKSMYYNSASECYQYLFGEDGALLYDEVEVPADQYDNIVSYVKKKIKDGEVPNLSDPEEVTEIIKKGVLTFTQAKHLVEEKKIDVLFFNTGNRAIGISMDIGLSAIYQYASDIWRGEDPDKAMENSVVLGLSTAGKTIVTSVMNDEVVISNLNHLLIPATDALVRGAYHNVSKGFINFLANLGRDGATIYAGAAINHLAKILRELISSSAFAVALVGVRSIPDINDFIHGRISGKQLGKEMAKLAGQMGFAALGAFLGGKIIAGAAGAATIGAASGSVVPGPGTIIGGLIGAIGGGMAVSFVADQLIEDDAVEMERIIENQFIALANEYLINEAEAATISDRLIEKLTTDKKVLKEMFASKNRTNYARNTLLLPEVKKVVDSRKKITFPSKEVYSVAIMEVLGDLYEAEAEEAS